MKINHRFLKYTAGAALLLLPQTPKAGISGTPHDFSTRGWGSVEICKFCHTPHESDKTVPDAPLWNHKVSSASYTVYSSPTLNAVVGQPAASSKLCLSCHDGTVAIDSFNGDEGMEFLSGPALLGADLSDDHPVSFTYDAALAAADGGLATPVSANMVDAAGVIRLFNGKLECSSCHDAHKNDYPPFLRADNTGSQLCLKCHLK